MKKRDPQITFDGAGNLKMSKKAAEAFCDVRGETRIRQALLRRSLAIDLTGMLEFFNHGKVARKTFRVHVKASILELSAGDHGTM